MVDENLPDGDISVIRIVALITSIFTISMPCAAENLYSINYSACMDNSGGVTVEMLDCIAAEIDIQDLRLNKSYKQLSSELTVSRKKQLTSTQRLWIQYRDANCSFYADPDGGTSVVLTSTECFLRETAERAKELETLRSEP